MTKLCRNGWVTESRKEVSVWMKQQAGIAKWRRHQSKTGTSHKSSLEDLFSLSHYQPEEFSGTLRWIHSEQAHLRTCVYSLDFKMRSKAAFWRSGGTEFRRIWWNELELKGCVGRHRGPRLWVLWHILDCVRGWSGAAEGRRCCKQQNSGAVGG